MARTFITNYFNGMKVDPKQFEVNRYNTDNLSYGVPIRNGKNLRRIGTNSGRTQTSCVPERSFRALIKAQRQAFSSKKTKALIILKRP